MKKHRFLKGALCGALAMLLIVVVLAGGGLFLYGALRGDSAVSSETESKINMVKSLIRSRYLYEEELGDEDLENGIIKGYVSGLNDPYSVYYTEEETEELLNSLEGEFSGIGVVVSQDVNTNLITLVTVYPDSPAEKSGLQENDIIYKVNGEDITAQDLDTVVAKIRGEKGTKVELTVVRGGEGKEVTAEVTRDTIEVRTVEHRMLEDGIGYIRITQFDTVTYKQFVNALAELQMQGAQGFVFDVRSNPGGNLDTVCDILDLILPEGKIVYTEDKNGKTETYSSDEEHKIEQPMAVLVNGNSASASEIFAGAIKDYEVGTIVGTTTYGKGIVQQLFSLPDGTCLKLTISEYFTPKGNSIHGKGVGPDVEVKYEKEDNQLDKACEIVRDKLK